MFGYIFKFIGLFFRLIPFFLWNRKTWLFVFFVIFGVAIYVAYHRIYFRFKRVKVGGKRTVLITGGSSGIGFSIAKLFVEDEWVVIIVARNEKKLLKAKEDLSKISKSEIHAWPYDLSEDKSSSEIHERLEKEEIILDVLVNNAGFTWLGEFVESSSTTPMIMTNCVSLTNLTRLVLPGMIERKNGMIMNVSSIMAYAPQPYMALYGATKAFINSFSMALSEELKDFEGVTCTILNPGPTKTKAMEVALKGYKETDEDELYAAMGSKPQSADDCAFEGYRGLLMKEKEVTARIDHFILAKILLSVLLPTFLVTFLLKKVMKGKLLASLKKKE